MINIKKATTNDTTVLAHLGRRTWAESHGHYVANKNAVLQYLDANFSIAKTKENLVDFDNIFYIIYVDNTPAGYAKIVRNASQELIDPKNSCRLERIFIHDEFIHLKIGQQLLNFVVEEAKALQFDTMWLTVYILNPRAIRFYERNDFKNVGSINFYVSGIEYENILFSKKI